MHLTIHSFDILKAPPPPAHSAYQSHAAGGKYGFGLTFLYHKRARNKETDRNNSCLSSHLVACEIRGSEISTPLVMTCDDVAVVMTCAKATNYSRVNFFICGKALSSLPSRTNHLVGL